jgi:hypothetical protein
MGFRVIIQSEKDTVHLENRVEAFLNSLQVKKKKKKKNLLCKF